MTTPEAPEEIEYRALDERRRIIVTSGFCPNRCCWSDADRWAELRRKIGVDRPPARRLVCGAPRRVDGKPCANFARTGSDRCYWHTPR